MKISLVFLICFYFVVNSSSFCPKECSYMHTANETEVECRGNAHWDSNVSFPGNTTKLGFYHTNLSNKILENLITNLTKLINLTLDDTEIDALSVGMFTHLTRLEELQIIASGYISAIAAGAFTNLKNLRRFRIDNNDKITFDFISRAIMSINAPSLNTFIINKQGRTTITQRPKLTASFYCLFANKPISTLVLTNDYIDKVKPGFSFYMSHVRCMIFRANIINRDWTSLFELMFMPKLRFIDASHQGKELPDTNIPDINSMCIEPLPLSTEVTELHPEVVREYEELKVRLCRGTSPDAQHSVVFGLNPHVRYIFINDIWLVKTPFTTYCFNANNSIRYIDASNNPFDYIDLSIGLLRLQYFNLQHNRITKLRYHTFAHFPSLTTLLLGGNKLAEWFRLGNATCALKKLNKLETLDLAANNISYIARDDLQFLMEIKNVNLSSNNLLPEILNNDLNLTFSFLNIAKNHLSVLPKLFRESLDKTSHLEGNLPKVDLSGNPFLCSCKTLDFLEWFVDNTKFFYNPAVYTCTSDDKTVTISKSFVKQLNARCHSGTRHSYTSLIVGPVFAVLLLAAIFGLSYRHKNKLNYYLVFRPYLKWRTYTLKRQNYGKLINESEIDVFVGSSYHDRQFVRDVVRPQLERQGLSVCTGDDFKGGECISDHIWSVIDSCGCMLIVVSKHLQKSKWCNYEIMTSLLLRKRVIVLSTANIEERRMLPGVIHLLQQTRYIYNTGHEETLQLRFWEKLAAGLKDMIHTTLL